MALRLGRCSSLLALFAACTSAPVGSGTGGGAALGTGGAAASGGRAGSGASGGRADSGGIGGRIVGSGGISSGGSGGLPGTAGGLGPFTGLDAGPLSDGGTITFQNIGAVGSYPSVCAPPAGGGCCRQDHPVLTDKLTPWDEDLIMTLRGPMVMKQFATYQPTTSAEGSAWQQVSAWDARTPAAKRGVAFSGNATPNASFDGPLGTVGTVGTVGSVCLVNASTDTPFGCGAGSAPYCAAGSQNQSWGWKGSKLFVFLASMPHVGAGGVTSAQSCAAATNGWTDAPWIGLSVGELIRAGAFSSCQCYEVTAFHGDGCGQFNAFEVINDNDTSGTYKNLDLFSSNFFGYGGGFGGPCGTNTCNLAGLGPAVDLVSGNAAAAQGGTASQTPRRSPNAFFRRPTTGYRYFVVLLDVDTRTVQMAMVHPQNVPGALAGLLPALPAQLPRSAIDSLLQLRLPR